MVDVHSHTQKIVVSSTQRIVVEDRAVSVVNPTNGVRVVQAGPVGPTGLTPPAQVLAAEGVVPSPLLVWVMNHDLDFKPSGWLFFNELDEPMSPGQVTDVTETVATATWMTPVSGRWQAS
jgi:hypothetical protein